MQAIIRHFERPICYVVEAMGTFQVSNLFEKMGFSKGRGIPDLRRLQDDGRRYNIGLPFSKVNHLRFIPSKAMHRASFGKRRLVLATSKTIVVNGVFSIPTT